MKKMQLHWYKFALFLGMTLNTVTTQSVAATCAVTSNTLSFGNYDVFSTTPLKSSGSIQVKCVPGNIQYSISLDNGLYGTIMNRKMKNTNGSSTLDYNLFTDATYATVWGDGTGGGVKVTGKRPETFTVYGRIPPLQDVAVGGYADTITITVNFD